MLISCNVDGSESLVAILGWRLSNWWYSCQLLRVLMILTRWRNRWCCSSNSLFVAGLLFVSTQRLLLLLLGVENKINWSNDIEKKIKAIRVRTSQFLSSFRYWKKIFKEKNCPSKSNWSRLLMTAHAKTLTHKRCATLHNQKCSVYVTGVAAKIDWIRISFATLVRQNDFCGPSGSIETIEFYWFESDLRLGWLNELSINFLSSACQSVHARPVSLARPREIAEMLNR